MNNKKSFRKLAIAALFLFLGAVVNNSVIAQNTQNQPGNRNVQSADQRLFDLGSQNGTIRVGVTLPEFASNVEDAASANNILNQISNYLQSPGVEVVFLKARVEVQAIMEARENRCAYILFAKVDKKTDAKKVKKSGFFDKIIKRTTEAIDNTIKKGVETTFKNLPGGQVDSGSVIDTNSLFSGLSKKADEVIFEYRVLNTNTRQEISKSVLKAKATSDNQDLIAPLVKQAGDEVLKKMFELTPPKTMNTPTGSPQMQPQIQTLGQQQYPVMPSPVANAPSTPVYQPTQPQQNNIPFNANVQSPTLQNIRLGMTFDEVKAQMPEKMRDVNRPDKYGSQEVAYNPRHENSYKFLDGKLVVLNAFYKDIEWKNIEEFISVFSAKLGLPQTWNKAASEGAYGNGYRLQNNGYSLYARRNTYGHYVVTVENTTWLAVYNQRIESAKQSDAVNALKANELKKANVKF